MMYFRFLFFILLSQQALNADEMQKAPLSISSKAKVIARAAEKELAKKTPEATEKAIQLLESVIEDISFKRLSIETEVPIFLSLAFGYQAKGDYKKQEKLLTSLIKNRQFAPFSVRLKVILGCSFLEQGRIEEAESILTKLIQINPKTVSQEEKQEIILLFEKLGEHYEKVLALGEKAFQNRLYTDAIEHFTHLKDAIDQGFYPKSTSAKTKYELQAIVRYRLGLSTLLSGDRKRAITIFREQNQRRTSPKIEEILQNSLFLLATALKKEQKFKESLLTLQEYLARSKNVRFLENAKYMAAECALEEENPSLAMEFLQDITAFDWIQKKELLLTKVAISLLKIPKKEAQEKALTLLQALPQSSDYIAFLTATASRTKEKAHTFLEDYPKSAFIPHIHHLLGVLYKEEKDFQNAYLQFAAIIQGYPDYEKLPEILYLAAEEIEEIDFDKARAFRKELILYFPDSPHAAESFFRQFPESAYRLSTPHAIYHLQEMLTLFPDSPYSVAAHFYIGNFLPTKEEKIAALQKADGLFEALKEKNKIPEYLSGYLKEVQIEALLGAGRLLDERATKKLLTLIEEESSFHYQEANFLLALCYADRGDDASSRKQLLSLIDWYNKRSMCDPLLTKTYLELAQMERKGAKFPEALSFLEVAEKWSTKEQLLEIWIAKSECYRSIGKLDLAMQLLSKVINNDLASQLRIKAMLLRANIYELQRRHDLAVKQLEAAANKGGEWGNKAKQKLEVVYGYK